MNRPLVIWGCGGFGREVRSLCTQLGREVAGFLDERPEAKGKVVDDTPVLGSIEHITSLRGKVDVLCAGVGDPALKLRFFEQTTAQGHAVSGPLVHPDVRIDPSVRLGTGTVVCEGSILTVGIRAGAHVILNLACTVGHDVVLEDFVTVGPGVNISGSVHVGEGVFLGTGSSVREKLEVGAWSVVGGGAFVAQNVASRTLVGGVPARLLRELA